MEATIITDPAKVSFSLTKKRAQRGPNLDRKTLRVKVLNASRALVQKEGFASLNIRGLASRTNCAVGSIYNIFENIDDIALQVNAQTLKSLLLQMKGISQKKEAPLQTPLEFGNCYISYGLDNYHLWNMLFEHRLPQV